MTRAYQVLARTYRPQTFTDNFLGQEAMIQVLARAITMDQFPHALMLSGTRGVGKTTTARIIAKTLNCLHRTVIEGLPVPCGACATCLAQDDASTMDVLEMDAASHTSIDDIRQIISTLPYRPTIGRYKIVIIDEVHMLSKAAFNALLKTLEEPPAHVIFIFATTELHKVPATILSRCMRFELRPFSAGALRGHLEHLARLESIDLSAEALDLIVAAAKGSARDALSLLDQARHLCQGPITGAHVRHMLGKAESTQITELLVMVLEGQVLVAQKALAALYDQGISALEIAQDFLEALYKLSLHRFTPGASADALTHLCAPLSLGQIQTLWMIVSKGYEDVRRSPLPEAALEMLCLRLMHGAGLVQQEGLPVSLPSQVATSVGVAMTATATAPHDAPATPLTSLEAIITLAIAHREPLLASHLLQDVRLVKLEGQELILHPTDHAPRDLAKSLQEKLTLWTGQAWRVSCATPASDSQLMPPTLDQQRAQRSDDLKHQTLDHPLVRDVLAAFPGAEIVAQQAVRHDALKGAAL